MATKTRTLEELAVLWISRDADVAQGLAECYADEPEWDEFRETAGRYLAMMADRHPLAALTLGECDLDTVLGAVHDQLEQIYAEQE